MNKKLIAVIAAAAASVMVFASCSCGAYVIEDVETTTPDSGPEAVEEPAE